MENKEILINFGKFLLDRKIEKYSSSEEYITYRPIEYDLLLCQLLQCPDCLLEEFNKSKYATN